MADDELGARIKRLEDELADLKAVHEADEELRRDAQAIPPHGLARLRGATRRDGYPETGGDHDDED